MGQLSGLDLTSLLLFFLSVVFARWHIKMSSLRKIWFFFFLTTPHPFCLLLLTTWCFNLIWKRATHTLGLNLLLCGLIYIPVSSAQMRKWWRTMNLHVTFSVSSSFFVRVITMVSCWCFAEINHSKYFRTNDKMVVFVEKHLKPWFFLFVSRFSELPENSNRQHHYHQCHHLHCGLPASTAGYFGIEAFLLVYIFFWLRLEWNPVTSCAPSPPSRLQESISDFYWYYSGKDIIDEPGKRNFSKAMTVAKQVFNSLTEYIQVRGFLCAPSTISESPWVTLTQVFISQHKPSSQIYFLNPVGRLQGREVIKRLYICHLVIYTASG